MKKIIILLTSILFLSIFNGCARDPKETMVEAEVPVVLVQSESALVSETPTTQSTPIDLRPMESSETEAWIDANLNGPDRCLLPCWWGIIPGETRWRDAEDALNKLGIFPSISINAHGTEYLTYETDVWHSNESDPWGYVEFMVDDEGIIGSIEFIAGQFPRDERFQEKLLNYTPEGIMDEYGAPTQIYLAVAFPEGIQNAIYTISLGYELDDFIASYTGQIPISDTLEFCTTYDSGGNLDGGVLFIKIGNVTPMPDVGSEQGVVVLALEDASGITAGEFYDLFITNESALCFTTSQDLWR